MKSPFHEPDSGALAHRIRALEDIVARQQLYIGSMRSSRFWKLRDALFGVLVRIGLRRDPLPVETADDVRVRAVATGDPYQLFRASHAIGDFERERLRAMIPLLSVHDAFAVIIDARGRSRTSVQRTLDALSAQLYPHWRAYAIGCEPHEADEANITWSWDPQTLPASEEFVLRLEAGDELEIDALLSIALCFGREGADVVYTDSDVITGGIPAEPKFKPDWSPETLMTRNYIGRPCVFRREMLAGCADIAWARGAIAWFEALLQVTERTDRVAHIARVLLHEAEATPMPSLEESIDVRRTALARRGEAAALTPHRCGLDVRYEVPGTELVSIVIPTRDRIEYLARCVSSVFEKTTYTNFEVIVVDNGSVESATLEFLTTWTLREPERFRTIRDDRPFNYSRLNNAAVRASRGSYVVLLNNDTEVITPVWLTAMLGQARRAPIGAVGALLLYPDGTIQHAGVVLGGVLGLAGHAFRFATVDEARADGALELDTNYLAVTGACLMVAREKYDRVGGLDESLAVAYNDVDFCAKLRAAGYRNVLVPGAQLYHYESKSRGLDDTAAKRERGQRESETFRRRWPEWSARDPYYNPNRTKNAEDFSIQI